MVRTLFPGHRRYSITHRAVQRLRELVPTLHEDDDEVLRDRLDAAITASEDGGRAVRTLDVMLGEPQILVPLETFGDILFAIIKEDTVVTVLPRGHGEEILQRGQALEQKVAAGEIATPASDEWDRWERRRWRREAAPPVVERVTRPGNGAPTNPPADDGAANEAPAAPPVSPAAEALLSQALEQANARVRGRVRVIGSPAAAPPSVTSRGDSTVASAIARGLERGRRRAAVSALADTLADQEPGAALLPLWNELLDQGLPDDLTVADLLEAVRHLESQRRP